MINLIPFGTRSGFSIPRVNIGAMRFPESVEESVDVVRYAIDSGMRYIDTSRGYGESEIKLGKALKNGYREKVILSTKWSPWITKIDPTDTADADCVVKRIEESLKRLDTSKLDFYQVWNVQNSDNWAEAIRPNGFVDGIKKAKRLGLVDHIGFTTHAPVGDLLKWLPECDWCEILLVTYNILNRTYEPVLELAKKLGIGTITMNPVGGGKLAYDSPVFAPLVKELGCATLAEVSTRWVLSNTNVDTLICGIGKRHHVSDVFAALEKPLFTPEQLSKVNDFVTGKDSKKVGFCTGCNYCMPCPQGVNIPHIMDAIYHYRFLGLNGHAEWAYNALGKNDWLKGENGAACINCGECVPKCTQHLAIPEEMAYAHRELFKP